MTERATPVHLTGGGSPAKVPTTSTPGTTHSKAVQTDRNGSNTSLSSSSGADLRSSFDYTLKQVEITALSHPYSSSFLLGSTLTLTFISSIYLTKRAFGLGPGLNASAGRSYLAAAGGRGTGTVGLSGGGGGGGAATGKSVAAVGDSVHALRWQLERLEYGMNTAIRRMKPLEEREALRGIEERLKGVERQLSLLSAGRGTADPPPRVTAQAQKRDDGGIPTTSAVSPGSTSEERSLEGGATGQGEATWWNGEDGGGATSTEAPASAEVKVLQLDDKDRMSRDIWKALMQESIPDPSPSSSSSPSPSSGNTNSITLVDPKPNFQLVPPSHTSIKVDPAGSRAAGQANKGTAGAGGAGAGAGGGAAGYGVYKRPPGMPFGGLRMGLGKHGPMPIVDPSNPNYM